MPFETIGKCVEAVYHPFFSSLIPAYVIERLYWEQRGMTIPLVVYTEILYAVTIILLEVPTGIMADRWGRQRMLVAGALLASLEFALLIPASGFGSFALVVIIAGIGHSARSGSENALLYDTLVRLSRASSFEKHLGRLNACDFVGAVTAALTGSLLAGRYGLSLNYWVSLASTIIALTFTLLLIEPAPGSRDEAADEAEARPPLRSYLTEPIRFFRLHPRVCLVMLSGMVTGASLVYIYEFWQLYADRLHFPVYAFGVLSSAIMLIQLPGSLAASWLKDRYGAGRLIAIILAAGAAGFACMAVSRSLGDSPPWRPSASPPG
ncbi:MFS transporter [Paenibacillus sp. CC-CFT747]|nr:MFS transporter [Paenibacillus sp. CC-CFT747]